MMEWVLMTTNAHTPMKRVIDGVVWWEKHKHAVPTIQPHTKPINTYRETKHKSGLLTEDANVLKLYIIH